MDRFPDRPEGSTVYMYDQPPPYTGIFEQTQTQTHSFDQQNRVQTSTNVANGFVDPKDPSKVYVPSAPYPVKNIVYLKCV